MKYISSIIIFFVAYFVLAGIFEFGETASVILSLIGATLFYNSRKEKKNVINSEIANSSKNESNSVDVKKESDENDDEPVSIFGAKPREGTEAHRVQQEVEKKKNLAKEKKVDELISELYFDNIMYYPSWIKHEDRSCVPAIITSATESKEKGKKDERDKKIISITLNERKYKFSYAENSFYHPDLGDSEPTYYGDLELFSENQKLLKLDISIRHSQYGSTQHNPTDIEAFIDGEWIEDFRSLKKQKQKDDKERALKKAEDPEKTNEMKNNFGIE